MDFLDRTDPEAGVHRGRGSRLGIMAVLIQTSVAGSFSAEGRNGTQIPVLALLPEVSTTFPPVHHAEPLEGEGGINSCHSSFWGIQFRRFVVVFNKNGICMNESVLLIKTLFERFNFLINQRKI